ncbi:MAG: RNA methyltransferase [bacterium]
MSSDVYIGLLHHPALDKSGKTVTTAVTNMDLHDLARLAATYNIRACYVIQPLELQKRLVKKLIRHWQEGRGAEYNPTRKQAFERMRLVDSLEEAAEDIEAGQGQRPRIVGTSARPGLDTVSFAALREKMQHKGPWLVLFGTGWGTPPEFLEKNADLVLEPIKGAEEYNHLSVRTAAAVVIDRLLAGGERKETLKT